MNTISPLYNDDIPPRERAIAVNELAKLRKELLETVHYSPSVDLTNICLLN